MTVVGSRGRVLYEDVQFVVFERVKKYSWINRGLKYILGYDAPSKSILYGLGRSQMRHTKTPTFI